jgi:hypothetical protein
MQFLSKNVRTIFTTQFERQLSTQKHAIQTDVQINSAIDYEIQNSQEKNLKRTKEFVNTPGEFAQGSVQKWSPQQLALSQLYNADIEPVNRQEILTKVEEDIINSKDPEEKGKAFVALLWLSQDEKVGIDNRSCCLDSVNRLSNGGYLIGIKRTDIENKMLDSTGLRLEKESKFGTLQGKMLETNNKRSNGLKPFEPCPWRHPPSTIE